MSLEVGEETKLLLDSAFGNLGSALGTFITLHKARTVYMSLEVGVETRLLLDSALGNFLCTKAIIRNPFFPGLPCPLKLS